jgi:hypothetical protein
MYGDRPHDGFMDQTQAVSFRELRRGPYRQTRQQFPATIAPSNGGEAHRRHAGIDADDDGVEHLFSVQDATERFKHPLAARG